MKQILAVLLSLSIASPALADFTDSNYFEPTLLCLTAGAGGYFGAPQGDEAMYAAGACAIGAGITYLINSHYEDKYSRVYRKQLDQALEAVKQFQEMQAAKAANGDEGPYSLRIREIVPPQKLSNGEVTAPTIREKLVVPGSDIRIGE